MAKIKLGALKKNLKNVAGGKQIITSLETLGFKNSDELNIHDNEVFVRNWGKIQDDINKLVSDKNKKTIIKNVINYISTPSDVENEKPITTIFHTYQTLGNNKLKQGYIDAINNAANTNSSNFTIENSQSLCVIIKQMQHSKISSENLQKLLILNKQQTSNCFQLFNIEKIEGKPIRLTNKRLEVLLKYPDTLKDDMKMGAIHLVMLLLQESKVPLTGKNGNLERLMRLSSTQIQGVSKLLQKMNPINQKRLDVLMPKENGAQLQDDSTFSALAESIEIMQKNNIPLSNSNGYLKKLMSIKESAAIAGVNRVLTEISKDPKGELSELGRGGAVLDEALSKMRLGGTGLTEERFKAVLKNADNLAAPGKADQICACVRQMRDGYRSQKNLLDALMELQDVQQVQNVAGVLEAMVSPQKPVYIVRDSKDFNIIQNNLDNLKDPGKVSELIKIIYLAQLARERSIPLTDSKNNLQALMGKTAQQLGNANDILAEMNKVGLNEKRFNVVMQNMDQLTDSDKAAAIRQSIDYLQDHNIALSDSKGTLGKIMQLSTPEITTINKIFNTLTTRNASNNDFKAIVNNLHKLKGDPGKLQLISNCIDLMTKNKLSLTEGFVNKIFSGGKDNIQKLIDMDREKLQKFYTQLRSSPADIVNKNQNFKQLLQQVINDSGPRTAAPSKETEEARDPEARRQP